MENKYLTGFAYDKDKNIHCRVDITVSPDVSAEAIQHIQRNASAQAKHTLSRLYWHSEIKLKETP